uniref:Uncharacterized protein n=1 Tax=Arundo donax TaxID=35708 RepID=A0A0A9H080_ARUDO
MDALAAIRNEETRLRTAGLLQSPSALAVRSPPPPPSAPSSVAVFIASTVIRMDMWRIIVTGRIRLRVIMVVVLHRVAVVLVVLVLKVLRGVLLVLRHRRSSCCFVVLLLLHLLELLVLLLWPLHRQILLLLLLSLPLRDYFSLPLQVLFRGFLILVHLFI